MPAEKPANMWKQSRTRLLGDVTERERLAAIKADIKTTERTRRVTSKRTTSRRWQCTARRFDPHYMPGYVCVHGVDHDGAHRDKHDVEWFDEDLQS